MYLFLFTVTYNAFIIGNHRVSLLSTSSVTNPLKGRGHWNFEIRKYLRHAKFLLREGSKFEVKPLCQSGLSFNHCYRIYITLQKSSITSKMFLRKVCDFRFCSEEGSIVKYLYREVSTSILFKLWLKLLSVKNAKFHPNFEKASTAQKVLQISSCRYTIFLSCYSWSINCIRPTVRNIKYIKKVSFEINAF